MKIQANKVVPMCVIAVLKHVSSSVLGPCIYPRSFYFILFIIDILQILIEFFFFFFFNFFLYNLFMKMNMPIKAIKLQLSKWRYRHHCHLPEPCFSLGCEMGMGRDWD
jgi:hypothetical protein